MANNEKLPLILISNDDGLNFSGIKALTTVAREIGEVVVVAPMQQQSGKASSITVMSPLRAFKVAQEDNYVAYAVNGTPTDCVKLALDQLLGGRKPDIMLSGVNHGYNTGICTLYSGTMGAAFEASIHGVKAVAFSYGDYSPKASFVDCMPWMKQIILKVLDGNLPDKTCLNVNLPFGKGPIKGIKPANSGIGCFVDEYEHRTDPHGLDYYWMTGEYRLDKPNDENADVNVLNQGYIAVTPCKIDQTDHEYLAQISALLS